MDRLVEKEKAKQSITVWTFEIKITEITKNRKNIG
jgi:hypothetical protein